MLIPETSINQIRELIGQRQFKELIEYTRDGPNVRQPCVESRPQTPRPSFNSMKEAMETALGEQTAEQFRKIEYLNIIGNLGPARDCSGTVLGMIEAFQAVARRRRLRECRVIFPLVSRPR